MYLVKEIEQYAYKRQTFEKEPNTGEHKFLEESSSESEVEIVIEKIDVERYKNKHIF